VRYICVVQRLIERWDILPWYEGNVFRVLD
jgi:hypothetical protein